ncbi:MAG TPA: peroxide stress protein YaaA [Thermoplasmata archaeon]|nr:peroxide stress protein YaaA [Thermoplasmata archaeon]
MGGVDHLLLIPDSHRKAKGDEGTPVPGDACVRLLTESSRRSLYALRTKVAAAANCAPGPDVVPEGKARADLLPASRRYQGNMYRRVSPEAWEKRDPGVEVLVLPALYGPVHSREPVRVYPFSMGESLPGLGTLHIFWRDHGLPAIFAEVIRAMAPRKVTDLLSGVYRDAVSGYLPLVKNLKVEQIDFPGMGRRSQVARGDLLAKLLGG